MALTELARYLPKTDHRNRFLRGGGRRRADDASPLPVSAAPHGLELPPGATFDPDPQFAVGTPSSLPR